MMGSENHTVDDHPLSAPPDQMENLALHDSDHDAGKSTFSSAYRSAFTTFSESNHHPLSPPIVSTPADSDPLLSPPQYFPNPNSPDASSYIDPPSYAEAVFTSFDGETNGVDAPSPSLSLSVSRSPSSSSEFLNITVSNPIKEQETSNSIVPGSNSYVTYLITTTTNIPEFGASGAEFGVRRRFRDVVTLSDRLAEAYRGFFIPPRPDKSVVESQVMQKQEFVEQRRVALEKYLRRLAAHPVIRKSDELRVFLQVQGRLPLPSTTDVASRVLDGAAKLPKQLLGESVIAPHEVVQPARGGRDLMRLFKELRQSVANDWGGSRPPVVEEDKEFLEKKEKINELELQINGASQQAESLVKAQQDMGETMGELGLAFIKLTKFENEEAILNTQRVRAADMKGLATAAVKASRLFRELNAQTVKHLDTLHEYLGLMLAVHSAFSERSSALLTVQTLLSELSALQSRAEKLEAASSKIFGADKSRVRKLEELQETIRVTEDAKNVATREYERIKEHNRSELERIDKERQVDFLNMLKGFVVNQVGYNEKIANVWTKVVEDTRGYVDEST
ncbi:sorting nexin 2B-like isoform X2 [Vigna radiata var. radiata]|uniref:Sorting nexin 2B-like isoform X2 n=1 Tax=Vigna radiata var. radiata TaxID=3916 RepID=A0A1S3UFZ3_VIGRR|nr:sorting nexin 2B-like isoform X2 [Vigna radiata var. radiata]